MKLYGGTKAMKRRLITAGIEMLIGAAAMISGGMLALRFAQAIFELLGVA